MNRKCGVVHVGQGRGFVVEGQHGARLIITAAHCLPSLPPCGASYEERTYRHLIGPLGAKRTVWAECLFADPVGDIAVFGEPDNQELSEKSQAYSAMLDSLMPFPVSDAPVEGTARVLSLDGRWFGCKIERDPDGKLWLRGTPKRHVIPGMSGSPILAEDGSAIGVCATGSKGLGELDGPNPVLMRKLPGWLVAIWARNSTDRAARKRSRFEKSVRARDRPGRHG